MLRPVHALVVAAFTGAAAFTQEVAPVTDINTGSAGACPSYLTVFDDCVYFRANDAPNGTNTELWRYDGAEAELAAEICPGPEGSLPSHLFPYQGKLCFSASGPDSPPRLWCFDGTEAFLAPGAEQQAQNPEAFIEYGGYLYYRAYRSTIGIELWRFDGVTQTPIDLFPGSGSSYPQHFIAYNGSLYFNACAAPMSGTELYRLDPGGFSVTRATSIRWPDGSSPEHVCLFDGAIYFSAYEPEHGRELWRYEDGDGASLLKADIVPGPESSNPSGLTVYRDKLYFCADNGADGAELWRFDYEAGEASMVADINPTPFVPDIDPVHHSWPGNFYVYDDILYFAADDGVHGRELWCYDGTEARLAADINPGPYGSDPGNFIEFRQALCFTANDGLTGLELFDKKVYMLIMEAAPPAPFARGDANADGRLDLSDAVSILRYLFAGGREPSCVKAADLNDDGVLTIADPISALGYLFGAAAAPPPPFGTCDADPTSDDLSCAAYEPCR